MWIWICRLGKRVAVVLYMRWTVCERCFVWCLDVSDLEHLGDTNATERRW